MDSHIRKNVKNIPNSVMNRINWIDNLKGAILVLVCLHHIQIPCRIVELTACGGMTTFFFLSGYLFSDKRFPSYKSYFVSKSKSLLLPYCYLSVLFAFINPQVFSTAFVEAKTLTSNPFLQTLPHGLSNYIYMVLCNFNTTIYGYSSDASFALWFVLTLFLVCVSFFSFHLFLKRINKCRFSYNWYIGMYAFFNLMLGWICYKKQIHIILNLPSVFSASYFFSLGVLLKKTIIRIQEIIKNRNYIRNLLFIVPLLILSVYIGTKNGGIGIHKNILGENIGLLVLSTITGIIAVVGLFILFGKYKKRNIVGGILRYIARNALIILTVHCFCIVFYETICDLYSLDYNPYWCLLLVVFILLICIPLFRCKLYFLIGKRKISIKDSLSFQ